MFRRPNVYVLNAPSRTEFVTREVHEHRAPTDESVRLLREMEAKAKDAVIHAVHVGDTTFECVVHQNRSSMDDTVTLLAIFSLNGKKMTAEFREHACKTDKFGLAEGLREAIADKLSREVLIPALINLKLA